MSKELKGQRGALDTVRRIFPFVMIVLTAVTIAVTGVIYGQVWWKMVPLYISLVVGLFQTQANRYATLVGGTNSVIYAGVNAADKLYAQSLYSLLVSCPVQIATFLRWSKNKYKQSTRFRKMNSMQRVLLLGGFAVVLAASCVVYALILRGQGEVFDTLTLILDTSMMLVGIASMILTYLSFVEFSWFMMCTGVLSILLDARMFFTGNPARITFLVFSVYSMICVTLQFITVQRLYKEQQRGDEE